MHPQTVYRHLKRAGVNRRTSGPRRYFVDHDFFSAIDTEEKAYWLGFLSADGYVVPEKNKLHLALAWKDHPHLRTFLAALSATYRVREKWVRRQDGLYLRTYRVARVEVSSKPLTAGLGKLGVTNRKSLVLTPWVAPSDHLAVAYWRGVFDGDGSISRACARRSWQCNLTGSEAMVKAFAAFAHRVCGTNSMPRPVNRHWRVVIGGRNICAKLFRTLYENCTVALTRKLLLARRCIAGS